MFFLQFMDIVIILNRAAHFRIYPNRHHPKPGVSTVRIYGIYIYGRAILTSLLPAPTSSPSPLSPPKRPLFHGPCKPSHPLSLSVEIHTYCMHTHTQTQTNLPPLFYCSHLTSAGSMLQYVYPRQCHPLKTYTVSHDEH